MPRRTRTTVFEVDKSEVVGAMEMVVDLDELNVNAAQFLALTTGPNFEQLMDAIQGRLEDAWHEIAMELVSEYVDNNVEVNA